MDSGSEKSVGAARWFWLEAMTPPANKEASVTAFAAALASLCPAGRPSARAVPGKRIGHRAWDGLDGEAGLLGIFRVRFSTVSSVYRLAAECQEELSIVFRALSLIGNRY